MPTLHGNTAFGYEFAFLFVGIPAVSAAPLPCGMVLLAANPLRKVLLFPLPLCFLFLPFLDRIAFG